MGCCAPSKPRNETSTKKTLGDDKGGSFTHSFTDIKTTYKLDYDKVMLDPNGVAKVLEHAQREFSDENILFWLAVQDFKKGHEKLDSDEQRTQFIQDESTGIIGKFLSKNAEMPLSLDSELTSKFQQASPPPPSLDMFDDAAKLVYGEIRKDTFKRFELTDAAFSLAEENIHLHLSEDSQDAFAIASPPKGPESPNTARRTKTEVEVDERFKALIRELHERVGFDRGTVWVHDKDEKTIWTIAADGLRNSTVVVSASKGLVGAAIVTGEVVNVANAQEDPRFNKRVDEETGYKTSQVLCLPVKDANQIVGALQLVNSSSGQAFLDTDIAACASFTAETVTAVIKEVSIVAHHLRHKLTKSASFE